MIRINVYLTEQQVTTLRRLAQASGITMAEMLRRILDEAFAQKVRAMNERHG